MKELPTKNKRPPLTHSAWILKTHTIRKGRRLGTWIEEGEARHNLDGTTDIYLHSTPIGGFDGHIQIVPKGRRPIDIMSEPQRPDAPSRSGRMRMAMMTGMKSRNDGRMLRFQHA